MKLPAYRGMIGFAIVVTLASLGYLQFVAYDDGQIFTHLLLRHDRLGAILMLLILLSLIFTLQVPLDRRRLVLGIARRRLLIAAATWLLLSLGTYYVYQNHPLSMDEYAAVFQATVFSEGYLVGRVPAEMMDWVIPRGFQRHFFVVNHTSGELASGYWPGFSLLLAPFVTLKIPWACNPLVVACSVLMQSRITYQLTMDEEARGWAILFALASPAFLINGISFYSMPAHLLFNLVFLWLLVDPIPFRVFLAGIVGSAALFLHNPFPHLVFALPWFLWLILRREGGFRNALLLVAGYLPLVVVLGIGWIWTLDVLRQPLSAAADTREIAKAGADWPWILRLLIGLTKPFQVPSVSTMIFRLEELMKLWLWSAPLLLLLATFGANRLPERLFQLMGASVLVTILAYFLVPVSQGHGWGARYSHSAFGVLPILAAAWIASHSSHLGRQDPLTSGIADAALLSLLLATGLRAWQVGDFMREQLAQLPPYPSDRPAIVLVRSGYYAKDLVQNDPWLRRQPWILASHGYQMDLALVERVLPGGCLFANNSHGWTYAEKSPYLVFGPCRRKLPDAATDAPLGSE